MIVVLGVFIFGLQKALYAVIAIVITTKVTDGFLEGMKFAKIAFIITDYHQEMADTIMKNLERGITGISSKGLYSGKDRIMLFCVVDKKQIVRLKEIVMQTDPGAFVIVTDARKRKRQQEERYRQMSGERRRERSRRDTRDRYER